uniref:Uncharacterized protein n=1 Tax=Amblyomma americanum TaxID=6943 RepID=A0A0C9S4P2_AMBAM
MRATVWIKVSVAISATFLGLLQLLLHLRSLQGSDQRRNGASSFVQMWFAFLIFFLCLVESTSGLSLSVPDRLCSETCKFVELNFDCLLWKASSCSEWKRWTYITHWVSAVIGGRATRLQVSKKLRYSCAALKTFGVGISLRLCNCEAGSLCHGRFVAVGFVCNF